MKTTTKKQNVIEIDADGKILGRLATEISNALRGKNQVDFMYHKVSANKVVVFNAEKIAFTGQKMKQKKYYRHSGYLGNLKESTLEEVFNKDPRKVLQFAVKGMLPKNRLQNEFLKNLTIYNGEINAK